MDGCGNSLHVQPIQRTLPGRSRRYLVCPDLRARSEIAQEAEYVAGISPWIFSDFHHPSPWFEKSLVPGHVLKGAVAREGKPKRGYRELRNYYREPPKRGRL
jgi:hypothetical protein